MIDVHAFVPSVDYADFLRVTLPHNRLRLAQVVIVTTPDDRETIAIARAHGADVHTTRAWTADGALFNGARAIEEAMDAYGRRGWMMQLSADIALPSSFDAIRPTIGRVYSAKRRMCSGCPATIPDESQWTVYGYHSKHDIGLSGYCLLWHADDEHLPPPPWQPIDWVHVGGSDSEFVARWPASHQIVWPFDVLHLGTAGVDWCGRVQAFADGTMPVGHTARAETLRELRYRRRQLRRRGQDPHAEEKIRRLSC